LESRIKKLGLTRPGTSASGSWGPALRARRLRSYLRGFSGFGGVAVPLDLV